MHGIYLIWYIVSQNVFKYTSENKLVMHKVRDRGKNTDGNFLRLIHYSAVLALVLKESKVTSVPQDVRR